MIRVEESVTINRPVEEVFAYATDPDRFPEWSALVQEVERTSEGPIDVGSTFRTALQFLGRRFTTDQVVTECVPNRRFAGTTVSGPIKMTITSTFDPVEEGTLFTWAIEGESRGFFGLADPLLARMGRHQIQAQVSTLKDLLESGAGSAQ